MSNRPFGPCGEIILDGSGVPELAPDLDYFSNSTSNATKQISNINATGGLTEIINLSGKQIYGDFSFNLVVSGDMNKILFVVDGVEIFNENPLTPPSGTSLKLFKEGESYLALESIVLSVEMATDTDISFLYKARPIK